MYVAHFYEVGEFNENSLHSMLLLVFRYAENVII